MVVPSENFGEGLDVSINHLLLGSTFTAGLIHNDEPVVVIATGKEWSHLSRRSVAEGGGGGGWTRVKRRIGRETGAAHSGTGCWNKRLEYGLWHGEDETTGCEGWRFWQCSGGGRGGGENAHCEMCGEACEGRSNRSRHNGSEGEEREMRVFQD